MTSPQQKVEAILQTKESTEEKEGKCLVSSELDLFDSRLNLFSDLCSRQTGSRADYDHPAA